MNENFRLENITLRQYSMLKDVQQKELNGEYDSRIEYYSDLIQIAMNKTSDEIDSLDIYDFKTLAETLNLEELNVSDFNNEIKIDGITYITSAQNNNFSFKVKEIQEIEKIIKINKNPETEFAAIIWREKGIDGKPVNDFSPEGINKRKEIFNNNLTIKFILPYLTKLSQYLTKDENYAK